MKKKKTKETKSKIIKELKWKWFMLKIKCRLMSITKVEKYMRKNYCRYGIHAIQNQSVSFKYGTKRMVHIKFLKCKWCNYKFFAKESDKKKYMDRDKNIAIPINYIMTKNKVKGTKDSISA